MALYYEGIPSSIDFYVTPAGIIVPWFVAQVNPTIQGQSFWAEYLIRKSKNCF